MAKNEKFDLIVRAKDKASGAIKGITKNIVGMVAAFASISAVGAFFKESIALGLESQKVYNDLSASVERHGMVWAETEKQFRSFAGALQSETSLSDEEIARSMQTLIDFGSSAEQAMRLVRTAADLAVGTNVSLASATDLVAKASIGYTSTLARYGIILDESIPKAEKFAAAIAKMNEMFGGAAAARMQSTWGKLQKLKEQFGDTQERIAEVFIEQGLDPLIERLKVAERHTKALDDALSRLGVTAETAQEVILELAGSIAFTLTPDIFKPFIIGIGLIDANLLALEKQMAKSDKIRAFFANIMDLVDQADNFVPTVAPIIRRTQEETVAFIETVRNGLEGVVDIGPTISAGYERFGATMSETRQPVIDFNDTMKEFDDLIGVSIPESARRGADAIRILTDAEIQAMAEAQALFTQTQDILGRGMTEAAHSILAIWSDTRRDMADIFKGMADDFFKLFLSRILQKAAFKATDFLLAGPLSFLGLGTETILGAAAGKVSPGGGLAASAGGTVIVNIHGPILGEEQYVREKFIPMIERAAELGRSKIVVRGA